MMNTITILVPTDLLSATLEHDGFHEPVRLRDELRKYQIGDVQICEDTWATAAEHSFLLVYSSEPSEWMVTLPAESRSAVLRRVFLLHGRASNNILGTLEQDSLAGGVDSLAYSRWQRHPERDNGFGVAGLRPVIERLGGAQKPRPFASDHYAIYRSPTATNLPQAIVEYLDTLARMRDEGVPGV